MEITVTWDEAEDETVVPFLARSFVVRLTMDDGSERDVLAHEITNEDGAEVQVETFNSTTGNGTGERGSVRLDRVRSVHVY